jgi:hypothetical protein
VQEAKMIRNSVLAAVRQVHVCELCGEPISHDVVRIDEGRIYHLSCFRRHLHPGEFGMEECPSCRTLGSTWDWRARAWQSCPTCAGSGYLSVPDAAC